MAILDTLINDIFHIFLQSLQVSQDEHILEKFIQSFKTRIDFSKSNFNIKLINIQSYSATKLRVD